MNERFVVHNILQRKKASQWNDFSTTNVLLRVPVSFLPARGFAEGGGFSVADTVFVSAELFGDFVEALVYAGVEVGVAVGGDERVASFGGDDDFRHRVVGFAAELDLDLLHVVVESGQFGDFLFHEVPNGVCHVHVPSVDENIHKPLLHCTLRPPAGPG